MATLSHPNPTPTSTASSTSTLAPTLARTRLPMALPSPALTGWLFQTAAPRLSTTTLTLPATVATWPMSSTRGLLTPAQPTSLPQSTQHPFTHCQSTQFQCTQLAPSTPSTDNLTTSFC